VSVYFGVKAADFFQQTVAMLQHFNNFERKSHCRADCLVCYSAHSTHRGLAMSIASLTSTEQTTAIKAVFAANDVRALVANHLGVSVGRVTDEAHFTDDLGALFFLRRAGDAMRSLTGWCRETRQPVDLQLYVDDTTLARIWSNVLRFQCPRCGTKHETEVQRLASKPLSVETPQTKRTTHQQTAIASPR
jgi:ribosomal protein L44E